MKIIPYELALLIGVLAFTYTYILTRPDQIFNRIYNRLDIFFKNDERHLAGKPTHPLFMIIIGCEKCFGGQAALWIFIAIYWEQFLTAPFFAALRLVFFVAFAIFSASITSLIYRKLE